MPRVRVGGAHPGKNPAARAGALQAALRLWRGRPLADLAGPSWFDAHVEHLDGLRRRAEHALVEARLHSRWAALTTRSAVDGHQVRRAPAYDEVSGTDPVPPTVRH